MNTKPYTCAGCGAVGEQLAHGGTRRWCDDCVPSRAKLMRAKRANTPKPAARKCLTCENGFPWAPTPYCSDACRPLRKCRGCGEEFNLKNRTYCSDACKAQPTPYREKRARQAPRPCEACGAEYKPCRKEQRYCSMACYNQHVPPASKGMAVRKYTPEEARERQRACWQVKNRRRRAQMRGAASEPYATAEIAERDRFKCGLCGKRVPMDAKVPSPLAATIDHILPLAEGGDDTRANVQLAHFLCNSTKGPRGSQQLALIG